MKIEDHKRQLSETSKFLEKEDKALFIIVFDSNNTHVECMFANDLNKQKIVSGLLALVEEVKKTMMEESRIVS